MWKSLHLLFLGCLLAFCAKAQATTITLNVTSPAAGALAGNSLHIVAGATSTYQVQFVTATVSGRMTNLTFDATAGWIGDLSLAGLPRGPQTLSLNATDVFANSGQTQVSFVHDQPPVLTVLEPTLPIFTHTRLHVVANATDDDPAGVVIRVYTQGTKFFEKVVLATATNSLDTFVDLSIISPTPWDGYGRELDFEATDSAGQITTTPAYVYVVSNTNVVEVDRVSGPIIFDVSAVAILFTNGTALESKSRINGAEQVLVNRPDLGSVGGSFLTPHGAIFSTSLGKLYEIRDGTLIDLGAGGGNLGAKGNYAIWNAGSTVILRDLLSGTNFVVSTNAFASGVAGNGDVIYETDWNETNYSFKIFRYRNGISTKLPSDGGYPITDGVNVGYSTGINLDNFVLFDGTNETILGPQRALFDRAVSGGWTAFTKPGTGQNQVWTRSPGGLQTQRTFFGFSSDLYALGPSGDLMTYSSNGRIYFIPNGSPPNDLGPWNFGSPFWIEGNWYASLGSSLVAFVVPSAPAISSFGWNTNGQFSFHVAAGLGQQVVTQESTDLFNWTSLTTNFVTSTFGIDAAFPAASGSNKKFYRVISVH